MIPGKYQRVSANNSAAIYKAVGLPDELIGKLAASSNIQVVTLAVAKDGSFDYTHTHSETPEFDEVLNMKLGVETESPKYGMKNTLSKISDNKYMSTGKTANSVSEYVMTFNNFGMTVNLSVQGTGISSTEVWKRMEPPVNGYYVIEWEKGAADMWAAEIPKEAQGALHDMFKNKDIAWSIHKSGGGYLLESSYGGHVKVQHMILDEELIDKDQAFGMETKNLMSEVAPGHFKMVTKNLKTGTVADIDLYFTEEGLLEKGNANGKAFEMFYRRGVDMVGNWRMVSASNQEGYLDACGVPEPQKSVMLSERPKIKIGRLPGGVIDITTDSSFIPNMSYKMGEQFNVEIPNVGTSSCIATENGGTVTTVMKMFGKVITQKAYISGDFAISEAEVDGCIGSRMKMISIRE